MTSRKTIGLVVVLLLIGAGYLWMFQSRKVPPLQVTYMQMTGTGPVFSFNDNVVVDEVRVLAPAVEPGEDEVYTTPEDRVMWHLRLREDYDPATAQRERRDYRALTYGQNIHELRPVKPTPRKGEPLVAGETYRFAAQTRDDGAVEIEFVARGAK